VDTQVIIVLSILLLTAVLFIIDVLRIDIAAILCLLALAWTGILEPLEALSGFSSNAVISIVAVTMMGRGIAGTGVMDRFSRAVVKIAGHDQSKIVGLMSATVGLIGAFIHSIGAAVLFLPAVLNVAQREQIHPSRLIMPVGFAVILSGTLTMVGSSPLILVNDFLTSASLAPYGLFTVTPVGLALLFSLIAFFFLFGRYVLPRHEAVGDVDSLQKELIQDWQLSDHIWHYRIPEGSPIIGKTLEETGIWGKYALNILAVTREGSLEYAPWRETRFESRQFIALIGQEDAARRLADDYGLELKEKTGRLEVLDDPTSAGFAEVIVPPRSAIAGESIRKFGLRRRYGVEPVMLYHRGEKVTGDFSDQIIAPGDIFIVHGLWDKILDLKKGNDFLIVTPIEAGESNRSKTWIALACFALAIGLNIAGFPIAIAFLSGAIAMVLTRVLAIEEAYCSVDWKVVFFLAGLIPLGVAMQKTGAAAFLADKVLSPVRGSHPIILLLVISGMATLFSLLVSNVAATVILAPMVIDMAHMTGLDPRPLVLLVAVSAANSFLLPTHQVNALLKPHGRYTNSDYLKAGGGMTVLFLSVVVTVFTFFYL
jgi:di/tricarboxylate transporter